MILDVGGGASTLAGDLLHEGYEGVVVLDLAHSSLVQARNRLGQSTNRVAWTVGDVLAAPIASKSVALWHDRAVFHFLTDPADRALYITEVRRIVQPGGLVLVATFAADGPERCSGLPVARYDPDALHAVFDGGFELLTSRREIHYTPAGLPQPFTYCLCRYAPQGHARAAA
jgi:ubiquinone/menaquinone biosynthesis C-methylase UbiE